MVIGMTNTEGGVLYLGVEDNGDITGVHKKHKYPNIEVKETMQGLLEAVAVDKGEIPLIEKEDMPTTTFVADDMEKIDR